MGWLAPNDLPTGKKDNKRAQIDLTKEVSHCGTVESAWSVRKRRARSTVRARFYVSFSLSRA